MRLSAAWITVAEWPPTGGAMSPGGIAPGGAARIAGSPPGGGTGAGAGTGGAGGMAAIASRWLGVNARYCDLTTAICNCS